MKRFEKTRAILTIFGAFLALVILFFGINIIENQMDQRAYAGNPEDDEDDEDDGDEDEEFTIDDLADGELLIGNTIYKYNADARNYLIIGTDHSGNPDGQGDDYEGKMADFLLLVTIDRIEDRYAFIQIDRDTVTKVYLMTSKGEANASKEMQICTAHWYGGNPEQSCENTLKAVSDLLGGMPIEGYYEMDMDDVPKLNHAVGGVTITINEDLTNADPTLIDGETITLTDEQAYAFVRARRAVGDGSNKERMQRQHEYMEAFLQQALENTKKDPGFPNNMFKEMKQYLTTNLNGTDLSKILNKMCQGENLGIKSFEGAHKIGQLLDDGLDHQEFYIDHDSFLSVMTELYDLEKVRSISQEQEEENGEED